RGPLCRRVIRPGRRWLQDDASGRVAVVPPVRSPAAERLIRHVRSAGASWASSCVGGTIRKRCWLSKACGLSDSRSESTTLLAQVERDGALPMLFAVGSWRRQDLLREDQVGPAVGVPVADAEAADVRVGRDFQEELSFGELGQAGAAEVLEPVDAVL